ncbi:hypothetical protein LAZ67_6003559 [Cordylochernes scorpioides]|uniref:Uncharacterized protein n=1 Tax=Cordylochernes scorpioides TaxID=51811 RepID=A0ABY6KKP6_9ARAC|nr:hypothetical protein LAZ67_6003559 [Cordylochernes scorpioides]
MERKLKQRICIEFYARREAFITLRDGVKLSQIPTRLDVKSKGVVTHVHVTYDWSSKRQAGASCGFSCCTHRSLDQTALHFERLSCCSTTGYYCYARLTPSPPEIQGENQIPKSPQKRRTMIEIQMDILLKNDKVSAVIDRAHKQGSYCLLQGKLSRIKFRVATLNTRGIVALRRRIQLCCFLKEHEIDICFLQETNVMSLDDVEDLCHGYIAVVASATTIVGSGLVLFTRINRAANGLQLFKHTNSVKIRHLLLPLLQLPHQLKNPTTPRIKRLPHHQHNKSKVMRIHSLPALRNHHADRPQGHKSSEKNSNHLKVLNINIRIKDPGAFGRLPHSLFEEIYLLGLQKCYRPLFQTGGLKLTEKTRPQFWPTEKRPLGDHGFGLWPSLKKKNHRSSSTLRRSPAMDSCKKKKKANKSSQPSVDIAALVEEDNMVISRHYQILQSLGQPSLAALHLDLIRFIKQLTEIIKCLVKDVKNLKTCQTTQTGPALTCKDSSAQTEPIKPATPAPAAVPVAAPAPKKPDTALTKRKQPEASNPPAKRTKSRIPAKPASSRAPKPAVAKGTQNSSREHLGISTGAQRRPWNNPQAEPRDILKAVRAAHTLPQGILGVSAHQGKTGAALQHSRGHSCLQLCPGQQATFC